MRTWAILLIAAGTVGCVGLRKPLPRWLVVSDPRVEIPLNRNTATAIVGDSVYIDVGLNAFDPDNKGYSVFVDGRRLAHPEWDIKDADLRYRFRGRAVGTHQIEILIPQDGGEPTKRTCVVNVGE